MNQNNNRKDYDGAARVTSVVKEIYPAPEPGWISLCKRINPKTAHTATEDGILDWSSSFGTMCHDVCLEGGDIKGTRAEKDLVKKNKAQFDLFIEKYKPRIRFTEEPVKKDDEFGNTLYGGTVDLIVRIKGESWVIDLKFWGSWKYFFEGYVLPDKEKGISSNKAAPTNLQTNMYKEAWGKEARRAVLWITPDFYVFHEFQRNSKHMDKAMEIASSLSEVDDLKF